MCLFLHSLLLLPVFILMASQATAVMRTMQSACCLKAAATCFSTSITSCTLAATALLCCISELSPWVSHTYGSHSTHTPTPVSSCLSRIPQRLPLLPLATNMMLAVFHRSSFLHNCCVALSRDSVFCVNQVHRWK